MKNSILAVALVGCFLTAAIAQDHQPATLGEQRGLSQVRSDGPPHAATRSGCPYFQSVYYYAGDFDINNQNANALSNEADLYVSTGSQVYQAFLAKGTRTKHHLKITGLCVNSWDTDGMGIDNPTPYEVRAGAKVGSGGRLVCSGTAISTDRRTGFSQGWEYAHEVKVRNCEVPAPAKGVYYWVNVEPQCFKGSFCQANARYFNTSNDENLNHVGHITPPGMALWNSANFGENWVNPNTIFGDKTFLSFSQGVAGSLVK